MSKKKNKWKSLPSVVRTCIVGMILFLVAGAGLLLYGLLFANVSQDDIKTVEATVVNIDKDLRKLDSNKAEKLRKKGYDEEYIKYEYEITYSYTVEGKEYEHKKTYLLDQFDGKIGDTTVLKYAIKNGEPVVDPDTNFVYAFCGIVLLIVSLAAGAAAYVLRPNNKKKNKKM